MSEFDLVIRSGTVAFNDHYFYMDRVAEVVEQSGLKAALTWCQFGIGADKEVGADLTGTLAFIDRWQGAAGGRIHTVLGPHSPYLCPPEFLREIAGLARDHQPLRGSRHGATLRPVRSRQLNRSLRAPGGST